MSAIEDNKLVIVRNAFDNANREIVPVPYDPGRSLAKVVEMAGFVEPTVVRNGVIAADLSLPLMPGDVVHVINTPGDDDLGSLGMLALTVISYYYVGPAASGYLQGVGMSAGAAQVWGTLAATALVTAGGMLINGNMASPVPQIRGSSKEQSPTYAWSIDDNTAREGIAIPVIDGNVATYPQIINQWLECVYMFSENATRQQWWHVLLCVAEGETNNVPTAEEIKIGGMPLTVLDADSYELSTTTGAASGAVLSNHESLHQLVPIGKELLIASVSQILLHFNGDDGSTDVLDDGVGTGGNYKIPGETGSLNTWTCTGSTALSTDHPFVGSAALEIPSGASNYISCDNWRAMALWNQETWDFECRFRQATLTDCCIAGQVWIDDGGTKRYFWSINYNAAGQLVYQQILDDISGASYTVFINLAVSASLSVDTWHHVRVTRSGSTVYIFLDGALLGSGNFAVTPEFAAGDIENTGSLTIGDLYYIEQCDLGHFYYRSEAGEVFTATEATALNASNTVRNIDAGYYLQGLGFGYYYNGSSETLRAGGPMELDEVRLRFYELIYDSLSSYDPPTDQIADDNEQTYFTKGAVDGFWVTVNCPYGLYFQDVDGLDPAAIELWISHRKVGTTTWSREHKGFLEFSRDPATFQWYFAAAGGRGQYEIRVTRIIWEWALDYSADRFQTTCYLSSIDEVLNESLTYPYLQLVGLSIRAQEKISGRPPAIRIESNRTSIVVRNYNGVGYRAVAPTNNAHAAFDMLTNRVYGLGIDPSRILQSDWESWANHCDGTVACKKRCQLNMVFDADYDFDQALQHVESCGRAKIVPQGSKITVVVDRPAGPTDLFCHENITPGTAQVSWLPQAERSDAVEISYRNKDKDFKDDRVFFRGSGYNALTRVPRVNRLTMLGINNHDQAMREAILRQQISEASKRAVDLQSGFESLKVRVGDVFDFASKGNLLVFTGRLARGASREETYTGTTLYLDKEITLDSSVYSGNCTVIWRNSDDTIVQRTVSGPFDTPTWSVTISATATADFLAPWIIGRVSGEKYQYKAYAITRNSYKDAKIKALSYDENAYYHSDYDAGATQI